MVKKRGIVWNFFTKKVHGSQITAFCKFCDQSYIQNATRMEKHIERCIKCPADVKRDFMNAVRNKKAKSLLMVKYAENWSMQPQHTVQNSSNNDNMVNISDWQYRDDYSNQVSTNETSDEISEVVDSKSWNTNVNIENTQSEEAAENRGWESEERSAETEPVIEVSHQESPEESTPFIRRTQSNRRLSQLPLLSGRSLVNSVIQNKIQHEQYLERRALRRVAELELQRKTLELQKYQWEHEREKTQSEARWAHECRMMQLKEEHQLQLIEQIRNRTAPVQMNQM